MDVALRLKRAIAALCVLLFCGLTGISPFDRPSLRAEENPPTLAIQPGQGSKKEKKRDELVTTRAFLSVDKLPPGGTCEVVVFVDVREGWHINQNPPMPKNLVPTKFSMNSKLRATLGNIVYPEGKPFTVPGSKEPLMVYEDRVAIRGVISVPEEAAGKTEEMELIVKYQACNERECKAPTEIKLGGKVPVARLGEPVQQINENLFPQERP